MKLRHAFLINPPGRSASTNPLIYSPSLGKPTPLGQLHPYFRLFLSITILVVIVTIAIHRINRRLEESGDLTGRLFGSLGAAEIVLVVGVTVAVIGGLLQEIAPSINSLIESLVWSIVSVVGTVIALLGAAGKVPRRVRLGAGTVLLVGALICMWAGCWFSDPYPVVGWANALPVFVFGLGTVYLVLYGLIANCMI